MFKYLLLLFAWIICFQANSQTGPTRSQLQLNNATGYDNQSGGYRKMLYLPNDTLTNADSGAIAYKNGILWLKKPVWTAIAVLKPAVDTLYRKAGTDSIFYTIDNVEYSFSIGLTLQQVTDVGQKTTDTIVAGGLRTQHILTDTADQDDFEIDIFPDLQVESHQDADTTILGSMFNWVVANRTSENIKAVLQVGDLTQDATSQQFIKIDSNYDKFDAMPAPQLPYLAVPGNHDFDGGGVGGGRFFTVFNSYMGPSRFSGKNFYGNNLDGSNENYYIKFKAGSDSVLVLGLEFLPRDSTLIWAQSVLDSFPSHKTMIVTHAYITSYGEKAMDTSRFSTNWYGMVTDNDGQDMWDKLIKKNKQIMFVFNGHYINNTTSVAQALANTNLGFPVAKRITEAGENGNIVYQLAVNYQSDSLGGNGYFMRMKFKPRTGKIDISFYSPYLNRYDARFPSYTLDYPGIKVDAAVGFSAKNGSVNVAGEIRFDSSVFITQLPKNRLLISEVNGKVDTLSNGTDTLAVVFSNGIDKKPAFERITTAALPLDSGKYILNQFTNPQTGNFWIKGKGAVGTHNILPTGLPFGLTAQWYVTQGSANWGSMVVRAAGASASGASSVLATTRGTDPSSLVASAFGDVLGVHSWFGVSSTPSWARGMYIQGFVYKVGSGFVSSGFDFRAIDTTGVDRQVMHITSQGKTLIGPSLTATTNPDRLFVDGTLRVGDTLKTPNILTQYDTTNFKPVVADANGNHFKMIGWPLVTGSITSINSQTGPGITIQGGTAVIANTTTNTVTLSVDPTSSALPRTLNKQYANVNNTGTGETDLYTYTLPSNSITIDGRSIHFVTSGTLNDATSSTALQMYFAGTSFGNTGALGASSTGAYRVHGEIIRTGTTTARTSVTFHVNNIGGDQEFTFELDLTGLDFTTTNILKLTGQAGGAGGGSNDITGKLWIVTYQPE